MKADYLTYRQATGVSLLGMAIQAGAGGALVIYGVLGHDAAAVSVAGYAAWGIVIWMALAIVFDQHRRERIEAMEADALAASATAGTSVFSAGAEEFRPAHRRLQGLYKYFFPAVSIATAAALGWFGYSRFAAAHEALRGGVASMAGPTIPGWGIAVGLGVSLVCFLLARYAAGLAKHAAYANLRAGAAVSVGTALFGLALGIGHFVDTVSANAVWPYLPEVFGVALMVLGAESLLNFLLSIYRPRKRGELPRPAFDSRLLGFAAAPDRIAQSISDAVNYQLGFDVTGGWFYKLLSRSVVPLLGLGVLVVWAMTAVTVVQPHQRAMILRFGEPIRDNVPPGLHLKAPWPIDSVYVPEMFAKDEKGRAYVQDYTVTGIREVELATSAPASGKDEAVLWTNDHTGEEVFQFVRPGTRERQAGVSEDSLGGADLAMVSVEIPMQYVVEDVKLFDEFAPPERRQDILKTVAQREVTLFFQQTSLDQVLGGDRSEMARRLQSRIEGAFAGLNPGPDGKARGAGVRVLSVRLLGVHPPKDTAQSFEAVVQADQRREATIEAARTRAMKTLTEVVGSGELARSIVGEIDNREHAAPADRPAIDEKVVSLLEQAGGSAAATIADARAYRWQKHMLERGRAERQEGEVALYNAAPQVYKAKVYFQTLAQLMTGGRVYIVGDGAGKWIELDLKEQALGADLFNAEKQ